MSRTQTITFERDLISKGYKFKRCVEDMYLYQKGDKYIMGKVDEKGNLEIILELTKKEEEKCR